MARFRIVCDGGGKFGFGNLRRSSSLALALRSRKHHVFIQAVSDLARGLLPVSPDEPGDDDAWLLDLPYDADVWTGRAREARRPVAALDFIGSDWPDLVISVFDRGPVPARHLVGLDYAIIRPEIAGLRPAHTGSDVVVLIGGGEDGGMAESVAIRIAGMGQGVVLIDGPLAAATQTLPAGVRRVREPANLAELMAGCAWAVTGGGGAMMEMMCLSKAVHVVPRTAAETEFANFVHEQGGLLGVGIDSLKTPAHVDIARVSLKAGQLVDGRGLDRIADAMESLL